ncbi:STAS domain-containing protein [Streptomyces sp. NPDC047081]|uniref:STAS domain-containing protein n=1 Tax=Streptomyces sp. NPDC047081 TaxID=3154706 RepID=UPI0033D82E63
MARLLHHPLRELWGIGARPVSGHVVVRLSGDITSANAGRIGGNLQAALHSHPAVLEIDLGEVSHVSGDGAVVFFTALREARARGTRLIVTHARGRALGSLRQLGLARVLAMYEGDGPLPGPERGNR